MSDLDVVAFYLPQFHPIPENDNVWGPGFTEWTNVTKARPVYPGHYQPHLPGELGFYDLRLSESRMAQAKLAATFGVSAFCYYHYWFNGRLLLERPLNEVLSTGSPAFPFCIAWANEDWTRAWNGGTSNTTMHQVYSDEDDLAHIEQLLPFLADDRYYRIDGAPLLLIWRSNLLPNASRTVTRWRQAAKAAGIGELHLMRIESFGDEVGDPRPTGFDSAVSFSPRWKDLPELGRVQTWGRRVTRRKGPFRHRVYTYQSMISAALSDSVDYPRAPCVMPSWDNSARRRQDGVIFRGSSPPLFEGWVREAANKLRTDSCSTQLPIFVNAWNEWAEGCHLEPDMKYGRAFLKALQDGLMSP